MPDFEPGRLLRLYQIAHQWPPRSQSAPSVSSQPRSFGRVSLLFDEAANSVGLALLALQARLARRRAARSARPRKARAASFALLLTPAIRRASKQGYFSLSRLSRETPQSADGITAAPAAHVILFRLCAWKRGKRDNDNRAKRCRYNSKTQYCPAHQSLPSLRARPKTIRIALRFSERRYTNV
jgi:hypothetical protein